MASVTLDRNIGLDDTATGTQTSTVGEPTAASNNNDVYVTGNWYASRSSDGGSSWTLVDPFTALPSAAGGFCCDQVALHDRNRGLWIWILQYIEQGGSNVFRVAVSTGPGGPWTYWDFAPTDLNSAWAGNGWFDYPDAATTDNHLYITFNVFNTGGNWLSAVAVKIPLDELASGAALNYQFYVVTTNGSLRLSRGATSDMFLGSHNGQNPVRVFRWPDAQNSSMSHFDVSPAGWSSGAYSAPGPGGEWLTRTDSRITGAWVAGNHVGFLWTASPSGSRPRPYVKAAVIDASSQSIVAEPDIWHDQVAWAYPAACPNGSGQVGVTLFFGGGPSNPTHVVGFLDGNAWAVAATAASTNGPTGGKWGDYLSCEVHDGEGGEWVASGYTLQGGNDRSAVEPRYVLFSPGP